MNELSPAAASDLGKLPQWNLGDLYQSTSAPALVSDIAKAAADSKAFRAAWEGKLAAASGEELGKAVAEYDALQDLVGRIGSYAQLVYAGNMTDPAIAQFYQTVQEKLTDIGAETIFFALEINRLDDAALAQKMKAPALAHYRPWLYTVRAFRAHQLSD